ncbi:hypothetical protein C8Q70DRAFT_914352 [Cubamyces menziesii]|nr:hypothetical protein C8Q70DRAFT_929437 [Cubamyces menziesii]KAI0660259.1 hypothetical protein C8Q70DRAFT_914352 [Cubamyces menziesii]
MAVFQNSYYIGNTFAAILYGVVLVLYFLIIRTVLDPKHKGPRSDRFFVFFSTALLCLNTVFFATDTVFGEEMWIVHADYPGGQDAYLGDNASVWYQTLGTAASIVLNLLSDGLLIYRCWIVWDDVRVVVLPTLIYLGAFSAGLAQLYESGRPNANYFAGLAQSLGIAYTSSVIGLNVVVTALICGRIYFASRRYAHVLGIDVGDEYRSATAIIVESALLYTLTGVAYLVSFALDSQTSIFFLSVYVMMTCVAPQMIVLRVISGRAWTRDRAATLTSTGLEFTHTAKSDATVDSDSSLRSPDEEKDEERSRRHHHQLQHGASAKQLELRLETKRSDLSSTDVVIDVVEIV